jgi:hypothetical protein
MGGGREREDITDDELTTSVSGRCGARERKRAKFSSRLIFISILFAATVQEN